MAMLFGTTKPPEKMNVQQALTLVAEETYQCLTCENPAQENNQYCFNCQLYWHDAAFEDEYDFDDDPEPDYFERYGALEAENHQEIDWDLYGP